MSDNPFILGDIKDYKRDINILKHYFDDQVAHLEIETGMPRAVCEEFVKEMIRPGGELGIVNPKIRYLERGENGDRMEREDTLTGYLGTAVKNQDLIAPTLTTYIPPHVQQSLLSLYIDDNIAMRKVAKKAKFRAEMAGQVDIAIIKDLEQTNRKLSNNACSGAHVSPSTPLYNKTAHNTLTSNCRSTSGYGNANNEKFLSGNRHYHTVEVLRNNIISIVNHTDYVALEAVMTKYGIRYPSVDETMQCIEYSARLYLVGDRPYPPIRRLVSKLTPLQRAAFVYTGDFHHLRIFNEDVVREFLRRISEYIPVEHPDPHAFMKNAPEVNVNLAVQVCCEIHRGISVPDAADWEKFPEHKRVYSILATVTENIGKVLDDYKDLIQALWVTVNMPASVAQFPSSIRRSALTSDTDSTIFTVQDWVEWYCGKMSFGPVGEAIAATMIFLASQTITHVLARMSANFGIEEKRLFQIKMKNEYYFPVFIPTQEGKHYYAIKTCQEGNLFKKPKEEIKGVHLKSSNVPRSIMAEANRMMEHITSTVMKEEKISLAHLLKWVGDIERGITDSVRMGSYEYLRRGQIKPADTYQKEADKSPYAQYTFWNEVFGPKYGMAPPPPYATLKVSVDLKNATAVQEWLRVIEDRELADRLKGWFSRTGKRSATQLLLPESIIQSRGIPEEIMQIVGLRKIILDTASVFYIILESVGFYAVGEKTTKLVSDFY